MTTKPLWYTEIVQFILMFFTKIDTLGTHDPTPLLDEFRNWLCSEDVGKIYQGLPAVLKLLLYVSMVRYPLSSFFLHTLTYLFS